MNAAPHAIALQWHPMQAIVLATCYFSNKATQEDTKRKPDAFIEMSPSSTEAPLSLPQPADHIAPPYTYILYDEIESTYFPSAFLAEGTLCWVLKSKGASSDELFLRARVIREVNDGRVLVWYPKGSEYRVRRCNL
jgi:hypothetical protein